MLEQQLAELTRRHNTSTAAWSVERSWMLATSRSANLRTCLHFRLNCLTIANGSDRLPNSSNASSGSIIAELQAEEVQRENIQLQSRVKELIGDLQLQSELHDATFMADGGGGGGGEESGGAVDEQVYADLDALREENSLLRTASPAAADSAAAQLHVAELRGELGAAQKQTAALSAQTGQLQRQLNRHIEEKESALRQMRELQVSTADAPALLCPQLPADHNCRPLTAALHTSCRDRTAICCCSRTHCRAAPRRLRRRPPARSHGRAPPAAAPQPTAPVRRAA